jgi:hypothetical protein
MHKKTNGDVLHQKSTHGQPAVEEPRKGIREWRRQRTDQWSFKEKSVGRFRSLFVCEFVD